jgi:hypothetical protein
VLAALMPVATAMSPLAVSAVAVLVVATAAGWGVWADGRATHPATSTSLE